MKTADIVFKERKSRAWTQEYLSIISGVSIRTIQRIEAGSEPSFETALALAAGFNIDVNSLFSEEKTLRKHVRLTGILALIFIFPPFYFAFSAILAYRFGIDLFYRVFALMQISEMGAVLFHRLSPIVFIGCGVIALFFAAYTGVMIAKPQRINESYTGVVSIYLNRSLIMLIPLALCIITAATFFLYALAE